MEVRTELMGVLSYYHAGLREYRLPGLVASILPKSHLLSPQVAFSTLTVFIPFSYYKVFFRYLMSKVLKQGLWVIGLTEG